jgi:hypothetical protein
VRDSQSLGYREVVFAARARASARAAVEPSLGALAVVDSGSASAGLPPRVWLALIAAGMPQRADLLATVLTGWPQQPADVGPLCCGFGGRLFLLVTAQSGVRSLIGITPGWATGDDYQAIVDRVCAAQGVEPPPKGAPQQPVQVSPTGTNPVRVVAVGKLPAQTSPAPVVAPQALAPAPAPALAGRMAFCVACLQKGASACSVCSWQWCPDGKCSDEHAQLCSALQACSKGVALDGAPLGEAAATAVKQLAGALAVVVAADGLASVDKAAVAEREAALEAADALASVEAAKAAEVSAISAEVQARSALKGSEKRWTRASRRHEALCTAPPSWLRQRKRRTRQQHQQQQQQQQQQQRWRTARRPRTRTRWPRRARRSGRPPRRPPRRRGATSLSRRPQQLAASSAAL